MSISEEQEMLLSQLVDHELPADQANQLLANMLDELGDAIHKSETCYRLKSMLQLHQALSAWRRQTPSKQAVVVPLAQPAGVVFHSAWRIVNFAAAAVLGGILVAAGFYFGGHLGGARPAAVVTGNFDGRASQLQNAPALEPQHVIVVTPEQRREIARAFALHESVAGPLSWYAADDSTIRLAPAEKGEDLRQPVAVVLRLTPDPLTKSKEVKTYVIVCRDNAPTTINLPRALFSSDVRLQLISKATDKGVNLQYIVAAEEYGSGWSDAALVGRRRLDLSQTSLGQLALNDRLVSVDASAWIMPDK